MNRVSNLNNNSHFEIKINKRRDFADLRLHGSVTLELINKAFLELLQDPSFRHNMNACYDYSDAMIETDMRDIEKHSQFVESFISERGAKYKLALVSDETLNSALLNVYKLLISKTTVDAEVFGSKKQALAWLTSSAVQDY